MTKSVFSLRSEDQLGLGVDEHGVKGGKELESDEDSEDEHNEMIPMKAQLTRNLANMMTNGYQDPTMRATMMKLKTTRKLDPLKIVRVKMTAKKKLRRSSPVGNCLCEALLLFLEMLLDILWVYL